jgi:hypothetical protein
VGRLGGFSSLNSQHRPHGPDLGVCQSDIVVASEDRPFSVVLPSRDDLYPPRFESRKTGRSGYAPACANEWVRGVCEKPRIKCAECPHRRFLPVTDDVIRWHLSGGDAGGQPFVAGVYPLLQDEKCFFLAVDFDKADWREDAAAFLESCRRLNLPAALVRSRSGRGAHVWFSSKRPSSRACEKGGMGGRGCCCLKPAASARASASV